MDDNAKFFFTSKHIESLFGVSRKVLLYWRKIGIIKPTSKTVGGHYQYTFSDLVTIKTIKEIKDAGISTNKLKKEAIKLKERFPSLVNPFSEKSFYVLGKEIAVKDKGGAYDLLSGQGVFIMNGDMKSKVKTATLKRFEIPANIKETTMDNRRANAQ